MKRLALLLAVLTAVLAGGFATAAATASGGSSAQAQAAGRMQIQLQVTKFIRNGRHLLAKGTAVATYTRQGSSPAVTRTPFTARVAVGGQAKSPSAPCPVLTLQIDQLSLDLLGLHVDLSKVILTITANANEGVLGKLFCQVANANIGTGNTAAAKLTRIAHRGGLSGKGVGFGVPARSMQAIGPGPCPIVDLLLGPLHLDLLGLIVDLNQIHLQITAAPDGGILGSLLCQLTGGPKTSTTTTTTAGASP